MVVRRKKGFTLFIRIFSIIVLPLCLVLLFGLIHLMIENRHSKEIFYWILLIILFIYALCFIIMMAIRAYNRNPNVIYIKENMLVIDVGYKKHHFLISSIEKFDFSESREITTIVVKVNGKRTKRILHFCNEKDLDVFKNKLKIMNKKII